METLRRVLGVAALESRWIIRQPAWLLQDLFLVAAFAILLWAWGGGYAARSVVIAWMIAGAWGLGVNMVGQIVGESRMTGLYGLYVASPLRPAEYLAGIMLSSLLPLPVSVAALTLLAGMLHAVGLVPAALAGGLMLLPSSVGLGLAIAMRVRKPTNIAAVTNPVTLVLTMLPPVFYPLRALPAALRPLALLVPTSAAAELARSLAGYLPAYSPQVPALVLAAWDVALVAAASRLIRWGHE